MRIRDKISNSYIIGDKIVDMTQTQWFIYWVASSESEIDIGFGHWIRQADQTEDPAGHRRTWFNTNKWSSSVAIDTNSAVF